MRIGFIGAGKVGTSLGKYFMSHGLDVAGYYDANKKAVEETAEFTKTSNIADLEDVVGQSDVLFLTVPDGLIQTVWNQIKDMPVEGKFICHCSGALSAQDAFPEIKDRGAFGYSIHPLFAVHDRYESYKELSHVYFTIEGEEAHLAQIQSIFALLGNPVRTIKAEDKVKYHLAAAVCSNHVIALMQETLELLGECGFDEESALSAIRPIVEGNIAHILTDGPLASLTGPVERGDVGTVKKHVECLGTEDDRLLYHLLSKKLLQLGKQKNVGRDYTELERYLG